MLRRIVSRSRLFLLGLFLVTTFVTTCLAGPVGVYLALSAALASLVFTFDKEALVVALRDWGVRGFVLSFFVIWLSFLPSAKSFDDVLGFLDFLALPVVIPAFALLLRFSSESRVTAVAALATLGALVALGTGLYEVHVLGYPRAEGNTSPIFFSGMAVLLCFFSMLGLVSSNARWRWIFLLGNAAGFAAAILGGTRGAMLGYGVLFVVFAGYTVFVWKRPIALRLLTVGTVLLSTLAFSVTFFDTERVASIGTIATEAATTGNVTDASTNQRFIIYSAAIQSFLDSPIYGHGWWNRFAAAVPYMGQLGVETHARDNHAHLHNDILNFGSAGGIIAIIGYLILMASPIVSAFRSPRSDIRAVRITAALGLVGAYMAMGAVDTMFVFEVPKSLFVLWSAVIMAFLVERRVESGRPEGVAQG